MAAGTPPRASRVFPAGSFDRARMQHVRHGARLRGQRTDARRLDAQAWQPRRCRRHQQGLSPRRLGTTTALCRRRVSAIFTRPSGPSALISSTFTCCTTTIPTAQIEPVLERLNRHIDDGKIAAMGASNWSHERIDDANAIASSVGLKLFSASSVQFSLADWTRPPWPGAVTLGGKNQPQCKRVVLDARCAGVRVVQPRSRILFEPGEQLGYNTLRHRREHCGGWSALGSSPTSITSPSPKLRSPTC